MAGPIDTRKRSREEEQNEFMPLSKRINNLHLNNSQHSIAGGVLPDQIVAGASQMVGQIRQHQQQQQQQQHDHHHHLLGGAGGSCAISIHNSHHLLGVMGGSSSNSSNSSNSNASSVGSFPIPANSGSNSPVSTISINGEILGDYCPVLSAEENPHYFTKNKILYELYVERMSRLQ